MSNIRKKEYSIAILQLKTESNYQKNLDALIEYIHKNRDKNLIIAPEVYLTGFDYANFKEASDFYYTALETLLPIISNQILILTLIKRENSNYFNQAVVLHNHRVVHTQNKYKLFRLGDEHKYFTVGDRELIKPFTINGIRYGLLICFELRFKELWRALEGVDIVLIPAMWGESRRVHLEILSRALAIMNQCFVIVSNSANIDMAKSSLIASPWGEITKDNRLKLINKTINLKEVTKVRRLVSMG